LILILYRWFAVDLYRYDRPNSLVMVPFEMSDKLQFVAQTSTS